jgi:aryl-alcohol dehydrogenase-like predicted oxidoreductase
MAFVMHQLWATVVLSGADTSKHLLSNLKALEVSLDGEDIQLLRKFSESPSDYRETRSGLAWN